MEIDALNMQDEGCINAQAVVNAALGWRTQRVSILLNLEATKLKSILQKSKVNEARVIDFSGIQRKEDVNEVSELSMSSVCLRTAI